MSANLRRLNRAPTEAHARILSEDTHAVVCRRTQELIVRVKQKLISHLHYGFFQGPFEREEAEFSDENRRVT